MTERFTPRDMPASAIPAQDTPLAEVEAELAAAHNLFETSSRGLSPQEAQIHEMVGHVALAVTHLMDIVGDLEAPPAPEYRLKLLTEVDRCGPTVDGPYHALIQSRAQLAARGFLPPPLSDQYSALLGDVLIAGLTVEMKSGAYEQGEGQLPLHIPEVRPFGDWNNYPTWIMHAWLSRDEATSDRAEELVFAAGDVWSGAQELAAFVAGGVTTDLELADPDSPLRRGFQVTDWVQIAGSFAPLDWEDVTEIGEPPAIAGREGTGRAYERDRNHEEFLRKAAAGELPCPHCQTPLSAERFQIGGVPEVRLYCPHGSCGFEEI